MLCCNIFFTDVCIHTFPQVLGSWILHAWQGERQNRCFRFWCCSSWTRLRQETAVHWLSERPGESSYVGKCIISMQQHLLIVCLKIKIGLILVKKGFFSCSFNGKFWLFVLYRRILSSKEESSRNWQTLACLPKAIPMKLRGWHWPLRCASDQHLNTVLTSLWWDFVSAA